MSACSFLPRCPHDLIYLASSFSSLPRILWFCQKCCLFFTSLLLLCHIVITIDAVNIAHNTTITLLCRRRVSYPVWYVNRSVVLPGPLYQVAYDPSTGDLLGILTIDGNETCGNMTVSCRVEGQTVYIARLNIEGW